MMSSLPARAQMDLSTSLSPTSPPTAYVFRQISALHARAEHFDSPDWDFAVSELLGSAYRVVFRGCFSTEPLMKASIRNEIILHKIAKLVIAHGETFRCSLTPTAGELTDYLLSLPFVAMALL